MPVSVQSSVYLSIIINSLLVTSVCECPKLSLLVNSVAGTRQWKAAMYREKRAASHEDSTQGVLINRVTQGNTDNLSYIELV